MSTTLREEVVSYFEKCLDEVEEFPVDFDKLWRWAGYSRKDSAKSTLEKSELESDIDYRLETGFPDTYGKPQGGRPSNIITLSIDAAKRFLLLANTAQGKEVRMYFIECEKKWRLLKKNVENGRIAMQDRATGQTVNTPLSGLDILKNEALLIRQIEAGIKESELRVKEGESRIKEHELSNFRMAQEIAESMGMDERDKIYMKDLQRRVLDGLYAPHTTTTLAIEDSNGGRGREISFPQVAQKYDLKYKPIMATRIGKLAVKLYRARYNGENPPKRRVVFGGRPFDENTYYEQDEDIVRYAVMCHALNASAEDIREFAEDNGFL